MISSRNQNQFPSSFAPLGDLLKTLMYLLNLNGFKSLPSPSDPGFTKRKGSFKVWKEKGSKRFSHFLSLSLSLSLSPPFLFLILHYLCVFTFLFLSRSSFMHCFV